MSDTLKQKRNLTEFKEKYYAMRDRMERMEENLKPEERAYLKQLASFDSSPCGWCSTPNNEHSYLEGKEIERKRKLGNAVLICEGPSFPVDDENLLEITWLMFRCVVTFAPVNPCDEDYMKEISS